jgi:hypothetical protein
MLHKTARERYEKLKKEFTRLMMDHFNRDDLDNFILTANSLPEWIEGDGTQEQKALVPSDADMDRQICRKLANRQKHAGHSNPRFRNSKERSSASCVVVKPVESKPGCGKGIEVPSKRVFGAGDLVVFEYDANRRESALDLVVRIFNVYRDIFEIAPGQGGNPKLFALTSESIARSAEGDVEEALKYHDEALRLKHRINRRRKARSSFSVIT